MYYPNLKTTDSELRALRNLSAEIKKKICPVFELTRSRKTKSTPSGSLSKRADQLKEAYSGRFILDLCTEPTLMNDETLDLFDEGSGYESWKNFLGRNFGGEIVPCALYVEDGSGENFKEQIGWIIQKYGRVCLRTSVADEFIASLYSWALEVASPEQIILCPILYYVPESEFNSAVSACQYYINSVIGNRPPRELIFVASSFPRSVLDLPGCLDTTGSFNATEVTLEDTLKLAYPNLPISNSDFASVHPRRYETKGGTWVPRIDYFEGNTFRYSRFRQSAGGYVTAAMMIDTASIARLPRCWGTDQISLAKAKRLPGASPSFWISVRINCWISKRA